MWIVYRKIDRVIVGMSADSEPDLEKQFALEEVVRGLADTGPFEEYDALQVRDSMQIHAMITAPPGRRVLRKGGKGKLEVTVEQPRLWSLAVQCDAAHTHPVDGTPQIPADGVSFTTISVQKVDENGEPQRRKSDSDLLYLRTDYGVLRSSDGTGDIDSVNLRQGQAAFRLISETVRRVATVQIFNADPGVQDAGIRVEFA